MKVCPKCKVQYFDRYDICIDCDVALKVVSVNAAVQTLSAHNQASRKTPKSGPTGRLIIPLGLTAVILAGITFPSWSFNLIPTEFEAYVDLFLAFGWFGVFVEVAGFIICFRHLLRSKSEIVMLTHERFQLDYQRKHIGTIAVLLVYLLTGPFLRIFVVALIVFNIQILVMLSVNAHDYIERSQKSSMALDRIGMLFYLAYFTIPLLLDAFALVGYVGKIF